MSADFLYFNNCTELDDDVESLNEMIEGGTEVTYAEVLEHCHGLLQWSESIGYDPFCDEGMSLEDDNMIGYCKGEFAGDPCYFVSWSSIEFIWKGETDATEVEKAASLQRAQEAGDRITHPTVNTLGKRLGLL